MKLDLTHEARNVLENAADVIYEQMQLCCEQRDELLYKCKGEMNILKMDLAEQCAEIIVLINKLKQAQFALNELTN